MSFPSVHCLHPLCGFVSQVLRADIRDLPARERTITLHVDAKPFETHWRSPTNAPSTS